MMSLVQSAVKAPRASKSKKNCASFKFLKTKYMIKHYGAMTEDYVECYTNARHTCDMDNAHVYAINLGSSTWYTWL